MGQSADQLRRDIEQTRGSLTSTVDAIGDRVSPGRIVERRTNKVRQGFRSVSERVMGPVSSAAGTVSDSVSGATGTIADGASSAVGSVRSAPGAIKQAATERTEGAPLAMGFIAFGAGLVAAALFKGSESEARIAQAAVTATEPAKEALTEAGRELATGLKEHGQQTVEEVKTTAAESAQDVKETAQQATQETVETSRQAAQDVKQQAQQATEEVKP